LTFCNLDYANESNLSQIHYQINSNLDNDFENAGQRDDIGGDKDEVD
jgi:hypothetical protein